MAEWLKKQAEREAEKEQRRLERLQRKLSEPKHQFTDPEYQQQCHDLSERLEDSVIKGGSCCESFWSSSVKVSSQSETRRSSRVFLGAASSHVTHGTECLSCFTCSGTGVLRSETCPQLDLF